MGIAYAYNVFALYTKGYEICQWFLYTYYFTTKLLTWFSDIDVNILKISNTLDFVDVKRGGGGSASPNLVEMGGGVSNYTDNNGLGFCVCLFVFMNSLVGKNEFV